MVESVDRRDRSVIGIYRDVTSPPNSVLTVLSLTQGVPAAASRRAAHMTGLFLNCRLPTLFAPVRDGAFRCQFVTLDGRCLPPVCRKHIGYTPATANGAGRNRA